MTENNTDEMQTSPFGDASEKDTPPNDANFGTITQVDSQPADELTGTLEEAGYKVMFDTGDQSPTTVPVAAVEQAADQLIHNVLKEAVLAEESRLPSQAIVAQRGRPRSAPAVLVEGNDAVDGPRKYLGTDGEYHVENFRAAKAFEDYFNMGATRSLARLAKKYFEDKAPGWEHNESEIAIHRKLGEYSANLDWQNRIRIALARQSALAVTNAQKQAARNRTERIRRAQKMQEIAETIFDRAQILDADAESLPPQVARQLIKPATTLMEIGMINERLEAGESLERIKPPKPIDQMNEEELDEYIDLLRTER